MGNSRSFKLALLLTPCLILACGDGTTDPPPDDPIVLALASGNAQSSDIETALSDPITVRATQGGSARSGISVTWSVTGGGGSVAPTTSTTDAAGEASTTWTLGATIGEQTAQAAVTGATGSPIAFSATGEDPVPPAAAAVTVADNSFSPESARIATGGTVTWTWAGANPHNVTFSTGTDNSMTQSSGTFARTFADAGSYSYLCTIHGSSMSGTVVVETP